MPPTLFAALTAAGVMVVGFAATYDPTFAKMQTRLASVAYCNPKNIVAWNCAQCALVPEVKSAISVDATLRGGSLQGYVAKMNDQGVIVSYRGTIGTLSDWLLDFEFFYKNITYPGCEGCELHEGFYGAFQALWPGVEAALTTYDALSAPYVYLTGHSLGAVISEIATFELVAKGYPVKTAYSFGTPRAGNPAWATAFYESVVAQKGVQVFRVIHDHDPVPHLPPQWLPAAASGSTPGSQATEWFRHPPTEVWYNRESSSFKVCSSTDGEDPSCSDSLQLPDGVDEHDHYLNISMSKC